jgi:BMFP domain-containing protein YqiC
VIEAAQVDALVAVMRADAEVVARAIAVLPREVKQQARTVLWRAFALIDVGGGDDAAAPAPVLADLLPAAFELADLRRASGDSFPCGILRLCQVRLARPLPDRILPLAGPRKTARVADAVASHFRARVALTEARIAWFEARANKTPPTHVATVRQPDEAKEARDALELLVRKGRSKFS